MVRPFRHPVNAADQSWRRPRGERRVTVKAVRPSAAVIARDNPCHPGAAFDDVSARPAPTGKRAANSGVIFRFDCYLHEFIAVLIGDGDCRTPIVIPVLGKFGSNFFCVGGRILLRVEAFAVLIHEFNVAVTDDVEKIPAHPHTPQHSRSQP
jgi:hypothetical protein